MLFVYPFCIDTYISLLNAVRLKKIVQFGSIHIIEYLSASRTCYNVNWSFFITEFMRWFYDMENTLFQIYVDSRVFKGYISSSYAWIKTTPKKYEKFKKEYGKCVYHIFIIYPLFQQTLLFVEMFCRTNCKIWDVLRVGRKA